MTSLLLKGLKYLTSPSYRFQVNACKGAYRNLSDEMFLKRMFKAKMGYELNLSNPQTFNEKLQWLKLYGYKDVYSQMADKYLAKEIVRNIIGDDYIVPCIGFWENPEEIDFSNLPQKFVLKCNHNSGLGRCICKNKDLVNENEIKRGLNEGLKQNYFLHLRETPYRDIKRGIVAEKFLDDNTGEELRDYKFLCFSGKPMYMYCTNKGKKIYENYYDMDFNPVNISHGYTRIQPEIQKPQEFELMKDLAARLSQGIPFVRIDFFDVDHHVYFAEFTFYDWAGFKPLMGNWDLELGKLIDLRIK